MINRHRLSIGTADERIALTRWTSGDSGKPPALLLHGTGFVADVWNDVACDLASSYTVYALDRRGHGESHKPVVDRYHFLDYAEDVCKVIEELGLRAIYGIGHSAGATDLLLATKLLPHRFSRLFALEPTVMDPHTPRDPSAGLSEWANAAVEGILRRQTEFDSLDAVFKRYRAAPVFAEWTESSLWAYIRQGFEPLESGRVRLRCMPKIEQAVLRPIFEAMEQIYTGDARGNPFAWFTEINCPVRVATTENSWPIYGVMASRAMSLIPAVSACKFDGASHCVAQEAPSRVIQALREFDGKAE